MALADRLKRGIPDDPGDVRRRSYGVARGARRRSRDGHHPSRSQAATTCSSSRFAAPKPLVKLLDFGLAKLTGNDDPRMERTRAGALLGTPAYMSPEQALGRAVDPRSDIYSFGVLAFEMLTGRLPFIEDTAMALLVAHMQQPPSLPSSVAPGIPPELDRPRLRAAREGSGGAADAEQTMQVLAYFRDTQHLSNAPTGRALAGARAADRDGSRRALRCYRRWARRAASS